MPKLAFKIGNDFSELSSVAADVRQFLETHQTSSDVVFAANLAIEELVSNTIKSAYDDSREHEITIHLFLSSDALEIEICDDGQAFDPFEQPGPDLCLPVQDRQLGGLGIHFVRNLLDACRYERTQGQNVVRLTKKL